jgi:hypothetical protein
MSLAPLVITAVIVEGRSKTSVARDYGITRFWVQTLVKRFQVEGEAALQPYSRRPHGLAPRSVRKYHVMLHSIFQRAVRDQLILTNPCEHTELPKVVLRRSSPLITLAAVFVAFAIMFTVDMLSAPPGKSSAGTADAPVGSAKGSASTGSPSPPRPPSSRICPSEREYYQGWLGRDRRSVRQPGRWLFLRWPQRRVLVLGADITVKSKIATLQAGRPLSSTRVQDTIGWLVLTGVTAVWVTGVLSFLIA